MLTDFYAFLIAYALIRFGVVLFLLGLVGGLLL